MRKSALLLALPVLLTPPRLQQADQFEGRPAFAEGVELGYYIWHDEDGWQMRWTTKGANRRFTGSVTAEGGSLKSLKRIDVEDERRVLYPGRRVVVGPRGRAHVAPGRAVVVGAQDRIDKEGDNVIVFSTLTSSDIDGFRFRVDDKVTTLRIVLSIDGSPRPQLVEIGRNNVRPGALPLVVRLK